MKKALQNLVTAVDVAVWRIRRNKFDLLLYTLPVLIIGYAVWWFLAQYGAVIKHFTK